MVIILPFTCRALFHNPIEEYRSRPCNVVPLCLLFKRKVAVCKQNSPNSQRFIVDETNGCSAGATRKQRSHRGGAPSCGIYDRIINGIYEALSQKKKQGFLLMVFNVGNHPQPWSQVPAW